MAAGERLDFSGDSNSSSGLIEIIGGEIEFDGGLTNQGGSPPGFIEARNATMRFGSGSGLTNNGSVGISFGTTDVFGDVANTGSFTSSGNSNTTFWDDVTNNGTMTVSTGSTAVFFGTLTGTGVGGAGIVFMEGDLRPGASPGIMNFGGDVIFGPSASAEIELAGLVAGSGHDQVNVAGDLSADGALDVVLQGGFDPALADTFDIFTYSSINGAFDINLPMLNPGLDWMTNIGAGGLTLTVIPEPSMLSVIGVGMLGMLRRRRAVQARKSKMESRIESKRRRTNDLE